MKREDILEHCLRLKGATSDFPFGPDAQVFKVMGKMFALIPADNPLRISLKCDPTWAVILRENYAAVTPAWHMNKRHWNGVAVDGSVSDEEVLEMIDHSYELVVKSLTQAQRKALNQEQPG